MHLAPKQARLTPPNEVCQPPPHGVAPRRSHGQGRREESIRGAENQRHPKARRRWSSALRAASRGSCQPTARDGGVLSPSRSRSVSVLPGVRSLPRTPMDLPNDSVQEARWAPVRLTVGEDEFAGSQRQRGGKDARRKGTACAGLDHRGQVLYVFSGVTLFPPGARGWVQPGWRGGCSSGCLASRALSLAPLGTGTAAFLPGILPRRVLALHRLPGAGEGRKAFIARAQPCLASCLHLCRYYY